MKPSELVVDIELKSLLTNIVVGSSPITVYSDGETPTTGVPDDYIEVLYNGGVDSVTEDRAVGRGYMIVALSCRLFEDGSVKTNRVRKILEQFECKVNKAKTEHYFFKLPPDGFITPTAANQTTGYSTTILNVEWRTL